MTARNLAWTGVALLGLTTTAAGNVITVLNPGFEDLSGPPDSTHFDALGRLRDGHFSGIAPVGNPNEFVTPDPIPYWVVTGTDVGTANQTAAVFPTVPDGQNVAGIGGTVGGGTISQTLSAGLAVGTYTLQVDVGKPGTISFSGYRIELLAGNTVLAEDNNTLSPASGTFLTSSISYTATAADPNLGQDLTIRLTAVAPGFASQADFDNVRLSGPQAVPEPSSIVSCAIGLIGVLCYRCRLNVTGR